MMDYVIYHSQGLTRGLSSLSTTPRRNLDIHLAQTINLTE
jgi:hypothetical protein